MNKAPIISLVTLLIPIAILPKEIQMLFLMAVLLFCILRYKKLFIAKEITPFLFVAIIQLIAIVFHSAMVGFSSRTIAAINTASLWIIAPLLYSYSKKNKLKKDDLEKSCFISSLVLIIFSLLMMASTEGLIGNMTLFNKTLVGIDWEYGKQSVRLASFFEYANLNALLFYLINPLAIRFARKKLPKILFPMFIIISTIPVFLCKSRIGIIMLMPYMIVVLLNTITKKEKLRKLIGLLGGIFLLALVPIIGPQLVARASYVANSREGSTETRTEIYRSSIEKSLNETPLFGQGVKEMMGEYPLGSHSTYIGLMYKTGIVGLMAGLFGFTLLLLGTIKSHKNHVYSFAMLCLYVMFMLEDIDGTNWFIVMFFVVMSTYVVCKGEKNEKRISCGAASV